MSAFRKFPEWRGPITILNRSRCRSRHCSSSVFSWYLVFYFTKVGVYTGKRFAVERRVTHLLPANQQCNWFSCSSDVEYDQVLSTPASDSRRPGLGCLRPLAIGWVGLYLMMRLQSDLSFFSRVTRTCRARVRILVWETQIIRIN